VIRILWYVVPKQQVQELNNNYTLHYISHSKILRPDVCKAWGRLGVELYVVHLSVYDVRFFCCIESRRMLLSLQCTTLL